MKSEPIHSLKRKSLFNHFTAGQLWLKIQRDMRAAKNHYKNPLKAKS
jgi:hypothetical protein